MKNITQISFEVLMNLFGVNHPIIVLMLGLGLVNAIHGADFSFLKEIKLPPGFGIKIYADNVKNARSMTWGEQGTLFVGSRDAGMVYALRDTNQDYQVDNVITIATGLNMPNGVAFQGGALYVAEISRLLRYDNIENRLSEINQPIVVREDFPQESSHGWKFIRFGPDGKLYIPVGAPCNICDPPLPFASITRLDVNQKNGIEIFARGIRNSVGFD